MTAVYLFFIAIPLVIVIGRLLYPTIGDWKLQRANARLAELDRKNKKLRDDRKALWASLQKDA